MKRFNPSESIQEALKSLNVAGRKQSAFSRWFRGWRSGTLFTVIAIMMVFVLLMALI